MTQSGFHLDFYSDIVYGLKASVREVNDLKNFFSNLVHRLKAFVHEVNCSNVSVRLLKWLEGNLERVTRPHEA